MFALASCLGFAPLPGRTISASSTHPPPAAASAVRMLAASRTYFATCVKGLEPVLAAELQSARVGAVGVREGHLGVHFEGDDAVGARATLWLRSALRVMELLESADGVENQQALYAMARRVRWCDLLESGDSTMSVQAVLSKPKPKSGEAVRAGDWVCKACGAVVFASKSQCYRCGEYKPSEQDGGGPLTHSHYTALTVKNAACDVLREERGWRPSVDTDDADLPLLLHVHRGVASLYRLLSGAASMHKRGYRDRMHAASLKEAVAAGLLLHAGYDPEVHALADPMCGSATFAIEAALLATRAAPGLMRPHPPPLLRWADHDPRAWHDAVEEARDVRRRRHDGPLIMANDVHPAAIALATRDARAAGVADSIVLSRGHVADWAPPQKPGLVVSNPPWGTRLCRKQAPFGRWGASQRFPARLAEEGQKPGAALPGPDSATAGACRRQIWPK